LVESLPVPTVSSVEGRSFLAMTLLNLGMQLFGNSVLHCDGRATFALLAVRIFYKPFMFGLSLLPPAPWLPDAGSKNCLYHFRPTTRRPKLSRDACVMLQNSRNFPKWKDALAQSIRLLIPIIEYTILQSIACV